MKKPSQETIKAIVCMVYLFPAIVFLWPLALVFWAGYDPYLDDEIATTVILLVMAATAIFLTIANTVFILSTLCYYEIACWR